MKTSTKVFFSLRQIGLWTLVLSLGNIPASGFSQTYEEMTSYESIGNGKQFLWLGGAALVGGIAGALAGGARRGHSHSHKKESGLTGPQGIPGPAGPPGTPSIDLPIAPGSLTITLTLTASDIPDGASGLIDTYLVAPNGLVITLATGLPIPQVTILGSGGSTTILIPVIGTYTIVAELSNTGSLPITTSSIGTALVTYSLGDTQTVTLPGIGTSTVPLLPSADEQAAQSFGFSPVIF
jgi:hypothetical protein